MAEIIMAPLGVMHCGQCGAVVILTAAHLRDVTESGKVWRACPGCCQDRWFYPFDPTPRPAPEAACLHGVTDGSCREGICERLP